MPGEWHARDTRWEGKRVDLAFAGGETCESEHQYNNEKQAFRY